MLDAERRYREASGPAAERMFRPIGYRLKTEIQHRVPGPTLGSDYVYS
jgi:hypothetical protein